MVRAPVSSARGRCVSKLHAQHPGQVSIAVGQVAHARQPLPRLGKKKNAHLALLMGDRRSSRHDGARRRRAFGSGAVSATRLPSWATHSRPGCWACWSWASSSLTTCRQRQAARFRSSSARGLSSAHWRVRRWAPLVRASPWGLWRRCRHVPRRRCFGASWRPRSAVTLLPRGILRELPSQPSHGEGRSGRPAHVALSMLRIDRPTMAISAPGRPGEN